MARRSPNAADIWFPLYAKDWLADAKVRMLTRTQRSILVDMWCLQWQLDVLPRDLDSLCRVLGHAEPGDVQAVIAPFFVASECGEFLFSERLRSEQKRAKELRAKKRRNLDKARKAKAAKTYMASMDRAMDRPQDRAMSSGPTPSPSPTPSPISVSTTSPLPPTRGPLASATEQVLRSIGLQHGGEVSP